MEKANKKQELNIKREQAPNMTIAWSLGLKSKSFKDYCNKKGLKIGGYRDDK